jgi:SAM-dependent methyltransferase
MNENSGSPLEEADYLRQRLDPRPADVAYLHLADLRLALGSVTTTQPLRVLDFGCGGSPYRSLFPNADYRRADFVGAQGLDYVISGEGRIDERDETFDLVLSTQVLEHCANAQAYLTECWRLLRPGGQLVCSTHGTFEDHACPQDFRRWTADGLRLEIAAAGFSVFEVQKVTCGPRVVVFLMQQMLPNLRKTNWFSWGWRVVGHLMGWFRGPINRACDRYWSRYRVMDMNAAEPGSNLYIVVLGRASKSLRDAEPVNSAGSA